VYVHVLVITSGQLPLSLLSVPVTVPEISQLSVQPKSVMTGTSAAQETVTAAGGVANTGAVVSSILIV